MRGAFTPLEIELVHKNDKGEMLILSIFAKTGAENAALNALTKHMPTRTVPTSFTFNPATLLPAKPGYYAYTGSITVPPCTEGVQWRIYKENITVSKEQLTALATFIGRNARLTQPAYMREVQETRD